ncbi:hypothetical protein AALP_AA7G118700 [Arabis alpina]|uniref:Uncharacterized protein n=1 Tax=Arabis alpina TaxID=50452 RepID=A0A087GHH3_ARAAL|nr:hypothetical protein AALP_AA7G118700 [Arabis alpina]
MKPQRDQTNKTLLQSKTRSKLRGKSHKPEPQQKPA